MARRACPITNDVLCPSHAAALSGARVMIHRRALTCGSPVGTDSADPSMPGTVTMLKFVDLCPEEGGRRTRAQNRAQLIATERRHNRDARPARQAECSAYVGPAPPHTDDDPPPF